MNYDACGRQRKTAPGERGVCTRETLFVRDQIATDASQKGPEPPQRSREQRFTQVEGKSGTVSLASCKTLETKAAIESRDV